MEKERPQPFLYYEGKVVDFKNFLKNECQKEENKNITLLEYFKRKYH